MCTAREGLASPPQDRKIANTYAHRNWSKCPTGTNYFWPEGYFSAPHKSNAPTLMPCDMLVRRSRVRDLLCPSVSTTARHSRSNPGLELHPAAFSRLGVILLHGGRCLLRCSCFPSSHRERCFVGFRVVLVSSRVELLGNAVPLPLVFPILANLQSGADDAWPSTTVAIRSFRSPRLPFFIAM